jgi:hypothetical protein
MILLYTNAKALESANVETVIVFRTLSIFATAYGDFRQLTPFPHHISIILLISCDCDAGSWTEACPILQLSEHSASWCWARSATYSAIKDSRCLAVTHLPKTSQFLPVTIRLVRILHVCACARARTHARMYDCMRGIACQHALFYRANLRTCAFAASFRRAYQAIKCVYVCVCARAPVCASVYQCVY